MTYNGKKPRLGEEIGGGFFVFRRGKKTGRVGIRYNTLPFEHPSLESAEAEAQRLTKLHKHKEKFVIFQQVVPVAEEITHKRGTEE